MPTNDIKMMSHATNGYCLVTDVCKSIVTASEENFGCGRWIRNKSLCYNIYVARPNIYSWF